VLKPFGSKSFILRGMLTWTIHDFPGYGTIAGVAHQGFAACPVCGLEFKGEHLVELRKRTYTWTRKWLLERHPYKTTKMKDHFNGQLETCPKLKIVMIDEQLAWVVKYKSWLEVGGKAGGIGDPSKEHGVKCWNVLYDLPYWKVCNWCFFFFFRLVILHWTYRLDVLELMW